MRTSELIAALAADPVPENVNMRRRFATALAIGFGCALALFLSFMGPRPDFMSAAQTVRFGLKFVNALALALPSLALLFRVMRPDAKPGMLAVLFVAPFVLLAAGVVIELIVTPSAEWMTRLIGHNMRYCTTDIPLMAMPILAGLVWAMRPGAPQFPGWTGALAGAAAAGLAAFLYAAHCPDDSPLFVATWYPTATLVTAGIGALAGRRWLSW